MSFNRACSFLLVPKKNQKKTPSNKVHILPPHRACHIQGQKTQKRILSLCYLSLAKRFDKIAIAHRRAFDGMPSAPQRKQIHIPFERQILMREDVHQMRGARE